ncbi:SMC-Scp complex subunit ScpB [Patescibacteria group bacterium]|nr:SMC-Scp complex subunit ScpB [Patescibacteria group bacterium]
MEKNKLSELESLLFASGKAMTFKELENFLSAKTGELEEMLESLKQKFNNDESGLHININNKKAQFVSNPKNVTTLRKYFNDELSGELSKPSLETLTIIAYRQPISKEELEQIRGVNCSLILRNLLIRGLVEESTQKGDLSAKYSVTMDFLRHLGINSVQELPDYEKLNSDDNLQKLLEDGTEEN